MALSENQRKINNKVPDGVMLSFCWCKQKVVYIPDELVRQCKTVSCGNPTCHE